jgi:hypothetical protein
MVRYLRKHLKKNDMKKQIITTGLLITSYLGFGQWNITGNNNTTAANFIGTTTGVNQPLIVRTNGAEAIRALGSNQFVGIGNANPLHRLSVAGNIAFNQNLVTRTPDLKIFWGNGSSGDLTFNTTTGLEVLGAATERMRITQSGNLGIGTGAPSELLHVNGTLRVDGTNGTGGLRIFKDGNSGITSHLYLGNVANNKAYNFQLNADGSAMTLWTYGTAYWTERFAFTESGRLGVGISNPQSALHLVTPYNSTNGFVVDYNGSGVAADVRVMNSSKALVVSNWSSTPKDVFRVYGDGKVYATEVNVQLTPFPDYVFAKNYKLMSLDNLESYINKNHHLPNVPSANEVEANGANLGELTKIQMEKIEELTLYILELKNEMKVLEAKVEMAKKNNK